MLFAESADSAAAFSEETSYCDGSDPAVLAAAECTVPMAQFWLATTATPFEYLPGESIRLQVRAWNVIGPGPYSSIATGPTVETPPATPSLPPERVEAGTSPSQIEVAMPAITSGSLAAGAAAISSYNLEWNEGSGTAFTEVTGETTESLALTVTVDSLEAGRTYTFRYRVKNIHGWSAGYSPEV